MMKKLDVFVLKDMDLIEKKSIKPEFCIVGEPTSMEVVIGHKGKHAYSVKVEGLACHSGQAPFGVNAINYASKLIAYIDKLNKEKSINGPFDYDYEVPYTTLHTGLIKGGTILNIVPDLCEFEFEVRNLIKDDPLQLVNKIKDYANQKLIKDMHKVSSKTGVSFNEKVNYPALDMSENIDLVKKIKELLKNNKHKKVVYGTEAGLFKNRFNIPTIVCGPGSIDQAHKPNEFISIEQTNDYSILDNLISSQAFDPSKLSFTKEAINSNAREIFNSIISFINETKRFHYNKVLSRCINHKATSNWN